MKILNDSDVLVCNKDDSVDLLRRACIATLDLSYNEADIDGIASRGMDALSSGHTEGIQDALTLFGELLGYAAPPKKLAFAHHDIIGCPEKTDAGVRYAPLVLYDRANNTLKLMDGPVAVGDAADLRSVQSVITGEETPDMAGPEVFDRLRDAVFRAPYVPA